MRTPRAPNTFPGDAALRRTSSKQQWRPRCTCAPSPWGRTGAKTGGPQLADTARAQATCRRKAH
eukprot:1101266-Pyramimonas_sp.AAC.1